MNKSEVTKAKAGINWSSVVTYISTGVRIGLMAYGAWFLAQTWFMLTPGWVLASACVLLAFGIDYYAETRVANEYNVKMEQTIEKAKNSLAETLHSEQALFDTRVAQIKQQADQQIAALNASTKAALDGVTEKYNQVQENNNKVLVALQNKLLAAERANADLASKLATAIEASSKVEAVAENIATVETTAG